jgi:citrate synthase
MDAGLEMVVAAHTVLSDVNGEAGQLVIRGLPVERLAATLAFEDGLHLLWSGFFDDLPDAAELGVRLGLARQVAHALIADLPERANITEALRLGWSSLPDDESLETALLLAASAGVFTAAAIRRTRGLPPLPPDPEASTAQDLLRLVTGKAASSAEARALDAYLVTVSEHGLNASTFAARVVASTRAGLTSAAIAGLSALKGPLHGGAPGPVLDMLDAIGAPERSEVWIDAALQRGERLMGFGHRVYRVRDPRADALKAAARKLPGTAGRIVFAEHIERDVLARLAARYPARPLQTNVEFYTAILLEALGLPRQAFTAIFACGRISGWIAHACEQVATGRLVRPRSVYCGPVPEMA